MGGPHAEQPVLAAGVPLETAQAAMIMVHGRGASARDILTLAAQLNQPGFTYLAPEAAGHAWYPYPFTRPLDDNQPWLDSALEKVGAVVARAEAVLPSTKVMLLGFSQGACLSLEFAARKARRWGGIAGLSGGLIGPEGTPRDYPGSLDSTPVFLGCSDVDPHIPAERVVETGEVLRRLDGEVTVRLYPGMGHEVNAEELEFVRGMMAAVLRRDTVGESAGRLDSKAGGA